MAAAAGCRHTIGSAGWSAVALPKRLRVSPAAAPSAAWLEYIPQLDAVASSRLRIDDGMAVAPKAPGLGIAWRDGELERRAEARQVIQRGALARP